MRSTRSRTHGTRQAIVSKAEGMLSEGGSTSEYVEEFVGTFNGLLGDCSISDGDTDEYTLALVRGTMEFADDHVDATGDAYEEAAGICQTAVDGHVLRLDDVSRNRVVTDIADGIYRNALDKQGEFERLHDAGVTRGVVLTDDLGYGSLGRASYDMDTGTTSVSLDDGRTYVNTWDAYQCYYRLRAVRGGDPRAAGLVSRQVSSRAR